MSSLNADKHSAAKYILVNVFEAISWHWSQAVVQISSARKTECEAPWDEDS